MKIRSVRAVVPAVATLEGVRLEAAPDSPLKALLIGGVPLKEQVARYGPFVMNTRQEILQAFDDYQSGKLGEIR